MAGKEKLICDDKRQPKPWLSWKRAEEGVIYLSPHEPLCSHTHTPMTIAGCREPGKGSTLGEGAMLCG